MNFHAKCKRRVPVARVPRNGLKIPERCVASREIKASDNGSIYPSVRGTFSFCFSHKLLQIAMSIFAPDEV